MRVLDLCNHKGRYVAVLNDGDAFEAEYLVCFKIAVQLVYFANLLFPVLFFVVGLLLYYV